MVTSVVHLLDEVLELVVVEVGEDFVQGAQGGGGLVSPGVVRGFRDGVHCGDTVIVVAAASPGIVRFRHGTQGMYGRGVYWLNVVDGR